jgi:hypothetical protein
MMSDCHTDNNEVLPLLPRHVDVWCPVYSTLLPLAPVSHCGVPCPQRPSSALLHSKIRDIVLWKEVSSFAECGAVPSAEARADVADVRRFFKARRDSEEERGGLKSRVATDSVLFAGWEQEIDLERSRWQLTQMEDDRYDRKIYLGGVFRLPSW